MADVKNDAEKLDKILSHLDSAAEKMDAFNKRMDAMEGSMADSAKRLDATCSKMDAFEEKEKKADAAKKDAEEEEKKKCDAAKKDAEEKEEKAKADAAKKDAEEKEEKAKADAAKADSADIKALHAKIDALTKHVPAVLAQDVRVKMVSHQAKAERVAQAFGDSAGAPPAVANESEQDYRIRLANKYQAHSKRFKDIDLAKIADVGAFSMIEEGIYQDAMSAAMSPVDVPPNVLIPRITLDATGRKITRYIGQPGACWNQFKLPTRFVKAWCDPATGKEQKAF